MEKSNISKRKSPIKRFIKFVVNHNKMSIFTAMIMVIFITSIAVSYTHLDVYKRQSPFCIKRREENIVKIYRKLSALYMKKNKSRTLMMFIMVIATVAFMISIDMIKVSQTYNRMEAFKLAYGCLLYTSKKKS